MSCTLSALALDQVGNAYVTGNGGTAKFGTNAALLWRAPYAGNDIAPDTDGNTYVTGFSTNAFATAKLDGTGSNLWVQTYVSEYTIGLWPNASQKIAVDGGSVFVAGWESWGASYWCGDQHPLGCRYARPSLLKYDSAGNCLWTNAYVPSGQDWGQTRAVELDGQGGTYLAVAGDGALSYLLARVGGSGQTEWRQAPTSLALTAVAVGKDGFLYATGTAWWTTRLSSTNGQVLWTAYRQLPERGNAIAMDVGGKLYAAGMVSTQTNGTDSALIRYDPANGNQLWTKRYDGPAHGDDGAVAMAIAPDGSIYVTGYSANTNGGSDIFVIKYVPAATIERRSDASMRVEFSGLPGQACVLEASTDLVYWATLGLVNADTNGVFQFDDTNAPFLPHRFYRWHYP